MNGGGSLLSLSPAECSLPLALAYLLPLLHFSLAVPILSYRLK